MDERNWFFRELEEGVIHFRDRLQFELKSEFIIPPNHTTVHYEQEFFFFIPESLKIMPSDYSKQQFYRDSTTIIRYKTPSLSLQELANPANPISPLYALKNVSAKTPQNEVEYMLQIASNIFRSQIRDTIKILMEEISRNAGKPLPVETVEKVHYFLEEFLTFQNHFGEELQRIEKLSLETKELCHYTREFQEAIAENYLTSFLDSLRRVNSKGIESIDARISSALLAMESPLSSEKEEEILLRFGQLNKWVYEALSLSINRFEVRKKHGPLLGVATAAVAASTYFILLAWNASAFAINTFWFFFLGVLIYLLRDIIKEGLRDLYEEKLALFFPDYTTDLFSPSKENIGSLKESFRFLSRDEMLLSLKDFDSRFFEEKPFLKPAVSIFRYKRELFLKQSGWGLFQSEIVTLFRFNIHRFLEKANDEVQTRLRLTKESNRIEEVRLPKIYPIELILKSRFENSVEVKRFLIVINKQGILRVQFLK